MKKTLYPLIFPVVAYILLLLQSDYLYAVEDNDLFVNGRTFFIDAISNNGGFWAWIGSFLTQFFYYPWLGSLILVGIWTATYYLIVDAFKLKDIQRLFAWIPMFALLISVTDLGYWMYYIKMPGYWFSQSVSFLVAVILTWGIGKLIHIFYKKNIAWILFIIAYFAVCQKFPTFEQGTYANHMLQIPFYVTPIAVVILPLTSYINKLQGKWSAEISTVIALAIFTSASYYCSFRNQNFHSELKMYRAIDECRWQDVIEEAKKANRPTNLMVVYKNIALMHTNHLTEMFQINNCGCQPETGDSLNVRISQQGASMIYYQFGQVNYAYRWAIENSVEYGPKVNTLKMVIRCAIINQEFDVAAKYIAILKSTLFYKSWAQEHEPMLRHADDLLKTDEYKCIAPLLNDDVNHLDLDEGNAEKWILDHFSDLAKPTSSKLEDLILCTSLWTEDDYSFCIHFYDYWDIHKNEPLPTLYQEGAILLGNLPNSPITFNNFPFDDIIKTRFETFKNEYTALANQGYNATEIGNRMKGTYGDTYWWYYYFYDDFKIY